MAAPVNADPTTMVQGAGLGARSPAAGRSPMRTWMPLLILAPPAAPHLIAIGLRPLAAHRSPA
jgi:hypothetical protein